jgi:hypothetical protein
MTKWVYTFEERLFFSILEYLFYKIFSIQFFNFQYIVRYTELHDIFFSRTLEKTEVYFSLDQTDKATVDKIIHLLLSLRVEIIEYSGVFFSIDKTYEYDFSQFPLVEKILTWTLNSREFDYSYDNSYYLSLFVYSLNRDNSFIAPKISVDTDNLYLLWYSLYLVMENLIPFEQIRKNLDRALYIDPDNPYLLLDYARIIGVHYYTHFWNNPRYAQFSLKCVYKAISLLWSESKGYMFSWLWMAYRFLWDYEKALYYVDKWITLSENEWEISQLSLCWRISILIELWREEKAFFEAQKYINNGTITLFDCKLRIYKNLARIEISRSQKQQAFFYLSEGLQVALEWKKGIFYIDRGDNRCISSDVSFDDMIHKIGELTLREEGNIHFIHLEWLEKVCALYITQ